MKRIFLVDDDSAIREVMTRLLEKENFHVDAFASAELALSGIDSPQKPDLVISDVQMPGIGGLSMVRKIRESGSHIPILLMTGNPTPEVEAEAATLGVYRVFRKPLRNSGHIMTAIRMCLSEWIEPENQLDIDRLRLSFLVGLSHEIRTPLTAIKLAIDGLFAEQAAGGIAPRQSKLLGISQRNIDRIIAHVEKQLALLQVAVGDTSVCRKLVRVHDLIPEVAPADAGEENPETPPVYLFTDPHRLQPVIDHILHGDDDITVECENRRDSGEVVIRFSNTRFFKDVDDPAGLRFENHACRHIIETLEGEFQVERSSQGEEVVLTLPIFPHYDRSADFDMPIRLQREAAILSGKALTIIKCSLDPSVTTNDRLNEFFQRCSSIVSDGDFVVRDEDRGSFYIALLERRRDEIDHVIAFVELSEDDTPQWLTAELDQVGTLDPDDQLETMIDPQPVG